MTTSTQALLLARSIGPYKIDSGSRFRFELRIKLMIWSMVGRVVDREGWREIIWKRNRGLGRSEKCVDVNQMGFRLSFWVLMADSWIRISGQRKNRNFVLRERERERMGMEMNQAAWSVL